MIDREAKIRLNSIAKTFRSIAVIGPRQSGKTTLCRTVFDDKEYISLENPDILEFANIDPRGFLNNYPSGAILDEIQRAPILFSYLQQILDETKRKGLFILTGSNQFLFDESITQSLAGRIGYQILLPCCLSELPKKYNNFEEIIFKGFYPEVLSENINPLDWYPNYINTYLERDVRLIKNINNYLLFLKFVKLCAGRIGSILNLNSLASDVGIDQKTAQSWIGILQKSFIIYLLKPYYNNFSKRIIKSPKLYFYDTGLASSLLGIEDSVQITTHPLKGMLFENLIIIDILKQRYNQGLQDNLYFWKDKTGREVDLLIDSANEIKICEIKSAETINSDFFKHLNYYEKLESKPIKKILIYGGDQNRSIQNDTKIISWASLFNQNI